MNSGTQESSNPQTTTPAEDETLKRNTDCVYFLASPLTCKKGIECEFRHSEEARMNPRDCWYWMNSNCLNPKCPFRHPPLEGLLVTAPSTSTRSSMPPSLAAAAMQIPTAYNPGSNMGKQMNPHTQATPCYYFQQGLCLKGDRCAFFHDTFAGNSTLQPPAAKVANSVPEPQIPKKVGAGIQRGSTQQQKIHQGNFVKPVELKPTAKPSENNDFAPIKKYGTDVQRSVPHVVNSFREELPRYKPPNSRTVVSADAVSRTHRSRQAYPMDYPTFQNGKEPDEFLSESSPGFDVLVDDELRDSDYYRNEDDFGRMAGHEGRRVNSVNELDHRRSSDYSSVSKFGQETYNGSRGFDSYGRAQDQFLHEKRRPSSERVPERPVLLERRGSSRARSPNQIDRSDLRYRLAKQRKVDGSRSAVSPDRRGEFHKRDDRERDRSFVDERSRDSRRNPRGSVSRESSIISNRLQGRIQIPGRSPPDSRYNDSHQEREMDKERPRGRSSPPGRLPTSAIPIRLQDRIKPRTDDGFTADDRSFRNPPVRRDEADNGTLNFAGPKRLADLKGGPKTKETRKLVSYHETDGALSFDGPKPLDVILKRKREEGSSGSGDDPVSANEEESRSRKGDLFASSRSSRTAESQSSMPFREEDAEEEEGLISAEGDAVAHEDHSFEPKGVEFQEEEHEMTTDKLEDQEQEFESYDQRDGESDYEPVDGGVDFKTEEDDVNAEAEVEEDFSDDDGDDFAKRIGVMFS